jgi:endoglucanase
VQFDSILNWTPDNLCAGQLGDRLPAWLWGLRADGSWGVMDDGPAADADLWIAYSLLEAARFWSAPGYAETGRKLLDQIRRQGIVQAGTVGLVLLPGPMGFELDRQRFRLNPSYLPEFMFRYFAAVDPNGPWQAVWDNYLDLVPKAFSARVAPDMFIVNSQGTVTPDTEREPSGSYDAIRVYLWAGISGDSDAVVINALAAYAALIRDNGVPPENVNPLTGVAVVSDYAPIGYSGAVLPYLSVLGDTVTLDKQRARLRAAGSRTGKGGPTNYYDQVLILFGQGWIEGRYRFDAQGRLQPRPAR